MITSARFTNINGMFADFSTDRITFKRFTTEVDYRFTEKAKSQQHGIYPAETYLGKRIFHVEGDFFGDNTADYMQRRIQLIGALTPRPHFGRKIMGTLDILFDGMSETLSCECTLDGHPDLPIEVNVPSMSQYQINWKAYDPRLYGAMQSANIAYNTGAQNLGGRSYNKTFNKTYAVPASTASGDVVITNSGNIETYPIVTIHGPCQNPQIVLFRSDGLAQYFILQGLVLPDISSYVVADFKKHTVISNNGTNLFNYSVGSDWWALEPTPMVNTVRFTADVISQPSFAQIQWRSAYNI